MTNILKILVRATQS